MFDFTAAQYGFLRACSSSRRLEAATTASNASAAREASTTAAREGTTDHGNPSVDRDSTPTTALSTRIAVVTIDDASTEDDADYGSDSSSDVSMSATDSAITRATGIRCDRLWPRAWKRSLLNGLRSRLNGRGLDFSAHVGLLNLDRCRSVSRSGLVLRDTL